MCSFKGSFFLKGLKTARTAFSGLGVNMIFCQLTKNLAFDTKQRFFDRKEPLKDHLAIIVA